MACETNSHRWSLQTGGIDPEHPDPMSICDCGEVTFGEWEKKVRDGTVPRSGKSVHFRTGDGGQIAAKDLVEEADRRSDERLALKDVDYHTDPALPVDLNEKGEAEPVWEPEDPTEYVLKAEGKTFTIFDFGGDNTQLNVIGFKDRREAELFVNDWRLGLRARR